MIVDYERYVSIEIEVEATVRQDLLIVDENYTAADIVDGLKDGTLITSLDHSGVETIGGRVIDTEDNLVARVIRQVETEGALLTVKQVEDSEEALAALGRLDTY